VSDFVFYPVTGNGLTAATAYTWNTGTINFSTPADWASVASFETLTIGGTVTAGTVPSNGSNVGLVAGAIDPVVFNFYTPDPANGDPFLASSSFPVDVVLNSGSLSLGNLLLSGFNQYASIPFIGSGAVEQFPTLDVEGASLTVTGQILDTASVTFPTINVPFVGGINSGTATGGGTIELGHGATVDILGAVAAGITFRFEDGNDNVLEIGGVSKTTPTGFAGTITGYVPGDTIMLPNVPSFAGGIATTATYNVASGVLSITVGDPVIINLNVPGFMATSGPIGISPSGDGIELVACFLPGTQIATLSGDIPVERLVVGDQVRTASGGVQPIVWIGVGRVLATPGRRNAATPVTVSKGALGDNIPNRDLRLTKGHSLYLDGILIPVEFLVNHRSIFWDDRAQEVTIYHVELASHDILIADGAPAESYRDDGNRWLFQNANTGWHLPPKSPCAPVLTGGLKVDAIWRRLLDRSGPRPGMPTTDDPDLHLMIDGQRVDPEARSDGRYVFRVPSGSVTARIISRIGVPQELGVARDPRQLGVAIRRISTRKGAKVSMVDGSDPLLTEGFHPFETDNGFRWTNGNALLPMVIFEAMDDVVEMELNIGCTTTYLLESDLSCEMAA
jgi:hypothetical protein